MTGRGPAVAPPDHAEYAQSRDRRLRDELVAHYDRFAVNLVRSFPTRREDFEDLVQVARIGLIHAVDRFDPARERPFMSYARATIMGELKRHVRDRTWRIRPPRSLQEHHLVVARTVDDLTQELGRSPRIPEVAARAGLTDEQVLEATEVARSVLPLSLDRSDDDGRTLDVADDSAAFAHVEDELLLRRVIGRLPDRERRMLRLRFEHELTQAQIGRHLDVSQMCISRNLARTLSRLRASLATPDDAD